MTNVRHLARDDIKKVYEVRRTRRRVKYYCRVTVSIGARPR